MTPISSRPASTLTGQPIPHHATFYHCLPPVHPKRRKQQENNHPPRSKKSTTIHRLHHEKNEPKAEVLTPAPRKNTEHLYVRPLTTRDLDTCLGLPGTKSDRDSLEKLLRSCSPTSLGVFTCDEDYREKMLGYIIGKESELYEERGEGSTIWIKETTAGKEEHQVLLVKYFVQRMKDRMLAKRIVVPVGNGEEDASAKNWWCGKAGFTTSETGEGVCFACF